MEKPQDVPTVSASGDAQTGSPRNLEAETQTGISVSCNQNQNSEAVAMDVDALESSSKSGRTTPEVSLSEDELDTEHHPNDDLFAPSRTLERKALAEAKRVAYNAGRVLLYGPNEHAVPVRKYVATRSSTAVSDTVPVQTAEQKYKEKYERLLQRQKELRAKGTIPGPGAHTADCTELVELTQQLTSLVQKELQKTQSSQEVSQKVPKPVTSKSRRKTTAKIKAGGKHVTGKPKPGAKRSTPSEVAVDRDLLRPFQRTRTQSNQVTGEMTGGLEKEDQKGKKRRAEKLITVDTIELIPRTGSESVSRPSVSHSDWEWTTALPVRNISKDSNLPVFLTGMSYTDYARTSAEAPVHSGTMIPRRQNSNRVQISTLADLAARERPIKQHLLDIQRIHWNLLMESQDIMGETADQEEVDAQLSELQMILWKGNLDPELTCYFEADGFDWLPGAQEIRMLGVEAGNWINHHLWSLNPRDAAIFQYDRVIRCCIPLNMLDFTTGTWNNLCELNRRSLQIYTGDDLNKPCPPHTQKDWKYPGEKRASRLCHWMSFILEEAIDEYVQEFDLITKLWRKIPDCFVLSCSPVFWKSMSEHKDKLELHTGWTLH